MPTLSLRSLMLVTLLPLGLAACGPEVDENVLRVCDTRAPRGSDAHFQCISDFESGAEVLPQGTPWDSQPWDSKPWDVQGQDTPWDSKPWDTTPWDVQGQGTTPWDSQPWDSKPWDVQAQSTPWDSKPWDTKPWD